MLKTAEPRKDGYRVGGNSRAGHSRSKIDGDEVDGSEVEVDEVGKKAQKTSKSKNSSKSQKMVGSDFLTSGAKLAFTELREAFLKALILHHFNPERHIRIEMDASGYAIDEVLNQLTSEGRWHPVAFFSRKMISAETRYETHDGEHLAIVEAFKT